MLQKCNVLESGNKARNIFSFFLDMWHDLYGRGSLAQRASGGAGVGSNVIWVRVDGRIGEGV